MTFNNIAAILPAILFLSAPSAQAQQAHPACESSAWTLAEALDAEVGGNWVVLGVQQGNTTATEHVYPGVYIQENSVAQVTLSAEAQQAMKDIRKDITVEVYDYLGYTLSDVLVTSYSTSGAATASGTNMNELIWDDGLSATDPAAAAGGTDMMELVWDDELAAAGATNMNKLFWDDALALTVVEGRYIDGDVVGCAVVDLDADWSSAIDDGGESAPVDTDSDGAASSTGAADDLDVDHGTEEDCKPMDICFIVDTSVESSDGVDTDSDGYADAEDNDADYAVDEVDNDCDGVANATGDADLDGDFDSDDLSGADSSTGGTNDLDVDDDNDGCDDGGESAALTIDADGDAYEDGETVRDVRRYDDID